jgi:pyrroline-5-carboxylate reductase
MTHPRIGMIGAGMMGEAMIGGLLKNGTPAAQIYAAEPRADRRAQLHAQYGITMVASNREAITAVDVVVFAIKPQIIAGVLSELRGHIPAGAVALSIMAGVTIATLREGLAHEAIVRAMPNTPAMIGAGMSGWTAVGVTDTQRGWAKAVLESFGQAVYVDNEHYINQVTALSGSGPGYVFLMLEALTDAGVHVGLARPLAKQLAEQTMLGSLQYAIASTKHPAELRNDVTSPAGTTAAGLVAMEKAGLRTAINDGVRAAYERSVELGKPQH